MAKSQRREKGTERTLVKKRGAASMNEISVNKIGEERSRKE